MHRTSRTYVTTDENGIAHLVDLDAGEIIVKEIRAPEGYLLDETEHHVRLESGKTAEITLKNSKEPSLTIQKIDSVTKQPMAGVKFSITVKNGKPLGEFLTDENGKSICQVWNVTWKPGRLLW